MTLLQSLQSVCDTIKEYGFIFEEARMMNVKADNKPFPCIFFEEYRDGKYNVKYGIAKTTRVQLYFMKLVPMHSDAISRETLREQIEREAVKPFIKAYNESGLFNEVLEWRFFTPPPRFDVNEVSIMLQFDCVTRNCL